MEVEFVVAEFNFRENFVQEIIVSEKSEWKKSQIWDLYLVAIFLRLLLLVLLYFVLYFWLVYHFEFFGECNSIFRPANSWLPLEFLFLFSPCSPSWSTVKSRFDLKTFNCTVDAYNKLWNFLRNLHNGNFHLYFLECQNHR